MSSSSKKTIILIGDWFVDENWLVSRQELYHSSHTGDIHYLARHKEIDRRIISLCGVGELFEVLGSYLESKSHQSPSEYRFVGYGVWNKADNYIMECIICDSNIEQKLLTPFTINNLKEVIIKDDGTRKCPYMEEKCKKKLDLRNLAGKSAKYSTNRNIRCYEGFGGSDPHLLYRFDWHLPINEKLNYAELDELKNDDEKIHAIIIEDHGYGVINDDSIKKLSAISSNETKWFLRTKISNPPWLDTLQKELKKKRNKLSLIVFDHQLANHKKGERRWLFNKELGRASLELLGEMTRDVTYRHLEEKHYKHVPPAERAALLLDNNTVIAKENEYCYSIHQAPGDKQIINIGRTTIFYAGLIAQILNKANSIAEADNNSNEDAPDFGTECEKALICAYEWSKTASKSWNIEEQLHFFGNYQRALNSLSDNSTSIKSYKKKYAKAWEDWNESSVGLGRVIFSDEKTLYNREVLQLWRGEGTLPGYICVGGPKRDAINNLVSIVSKFSKDKAPTHALSTLIISSPGWGKSYLAKCIANNFDMEYLEYSVAQMPTSKDLTDCLATIASVQNRTKKRTLVFIDEINAEIEGNNVMDLLLSPLWDGIFMINGKSYKLDPGVWIFASTARLNRIVKLNKGSDFTSRLNGPIIELDALGSKRLTSIINEARDSLHNKGDIDAKSIYKSIKYRLFKRDRKDALKSEQVYLMVTLLSNFWGPINRIQENVMWLFHNIVPINGIRSLEYFASKFEEVRNGEIVASNVPKVEHYEALFRHIILPPDWLIENDRFNKNPDPKENERFVKIEGILKKEI